MIAPLVLAAAFSTASAHRTVSTQDAQAQQLFDRALMSFYAYDREGAARQFAQALQRDPHLAMAAWGEALAAAGDLNHALTPDSFLAAQAAVKQAVLLESFASPAERAYIDALALRYAGSWDRRETDEQRYVQAMQTIVAHNPLDDDAATITAEALLEDRDPPQQAAALLAPVLMRHPGSVMANHLCIHAYDNVPDPSPALPCADRLNAMTFLPAHEHLAHMPAHAYTETGEYAKAMAASERAWQLRQTWNQTSPPYELEYSAHDAAVGYAAAMMLGDERAALLWAGRLGTEAQTPLRLTTLARFSRWDEIIASAGEPDAHKRFALGLAYANTGNLTGAQEQLETLRRDASVSEFPELLNALLQEKAGNLSGAIASLQRAIEVQRLEYVAEYIPLFPAGEMLGALYLRANRFGDARKTLQATLERYPGDPRALSALALACARTQDCAQAGVRL